MCPIYDVLVAFYAVLLQNCDLRGFVAILFCRKVRTFAWRKIQPRFSPLEEKMTNIRYDDDGDSEYDK